MLLFAAHSIITKKSLSSNLFFFITTITNTDRINIHYFFVASTKNVPSFRPFLVRFQAFEREAVLLVDCDGFLGAVVVVVVVAAVVVAAVGLVLIVRVVGRTDLDFRTLPNGFVGVVTAGDVVELDEPLPLLLLLPPPPPPLPLFCFFGAVEEVDVEAMEERRVVNVLLPPPPLPLFDVDLVSPLAVVVPDFSRYSITSI
jgi:hypothetical protein